MTRAIVFGAALFWLVTLAVTGGGIVLGKLLLHDPTAVYLTFVTNTDFTITWLDTQTGIVYRRAIRYAVLPSTIDNRCRILFPRVINGEVNLVYLNLQTGHEQAYLPGYSSLSDASWLPDNRHLWVREMDGHISHHVILDTVTGSTVPLNIPSTNFIPSGYASWSPDSRYGLVYLYAIGMTTFVGMVSTETGNVVALPVNPGIITSAWSPDGQLLATQNSRLNNLLLLDGTGEIRYQHEFGDVPNNIPPLWLDNDRLLVLARANEDERVFTGQIWSLRANTLEATPLQVPLKSATGEGMGGWSPDNAWLYYTLDGKTHIYAAQTVALQTQFDSTAYDATWSPDSRYLVEYEVGSESLIVTHIDSGTVARFPGFRINPAGQWSSDNRRLSIFDRAHTIAGQVAVSEKDIRLDMNLDVKGAYSFALCQGGAEA